MLEVLFMSATISTPSVESTPTTPPTDVTSVAAEPAIATTPARAIAFASTVVTSVLDALAAFHVSARGAATAGLDYGDSVGRNVSAASRRFVDRVDVAAGEGLAKARTFALAKLERVRASA
jgi:hypothetical protein